MFDKTRLMQFALYCWPQAIPRDDGRWRRGWVIRSSREVPLPDVLNDIAAAARQRAETQIRKRLGDDFVKRPSVVPEVELIRIDGSHVISWIVTGNPNEIGNEVTMMGLVEVLRELDQRIVIQDLQGMPREFWIILNPEDAPDRNSVSS